MGDCKLPRSLRPTRNNCSSPLILRQFPSTVKLESEGKFALVALLLLGMGFPIVAAETGTPSTANEGVQIIQLTNRLRIEINGGLFTEYFFEVPRPYYYPLIGPDNLAMTRSWPMENPPGEEHDHPHHRSLWFAHGGVNGQDFWSEKAGFGKIVHEGFDKVKSGKKFGIIKSRDNWVAADGTVICTDERVFKVYNTGPAGERMFDFEIVLHASNAGDVTFQDTKEGTMAVRLAETMRLKGKIGHGHIIESTGACDEKTWGKRADWCDYSGPVDGKTVGIAIFDHPQNPRHPDWHVRDYGRLFAANPFGRHDFESSARQVDYWKSEGPRREKRDLSLSFLFARGGRAASQVADKYLDYSAIKVGRPEPQFRQR